MRTSIPASLVANPQQVTRIQNSIVDKLAAIPGVTSVGFASAAPMEAIEPNWDEIYFEGESMGETAPLRLFKNVSPDYFRTTGTKLIAGRELTWTEIYGCLLYTSRCV